MQWFVPEEQGSSLGPGGMGGYAWVVCIPEEEGRSTEVAEADGISVGSEGGAILVERRNSDCTGERVEAC